MASSTQIQAESIPSAPVVEPPPTIEEPASAGKQAVEGQAQGPKKDDKSKRSEGSKGSKSPKGSKGSKDADVAAASAQGPSVAAHPRAARGVARARGWGGLGGFLIAGYLSLPTGTLASAGLRALIAGTVCYLVVWAGAVFFWRRLVMVELRAKEHALRVSAAGSEAPMPSAPPNGARAPA
jgi:hypothetical protein